MDGVNGISGAHALIGGVAYACLAGWRQDGFGVAGGLALAVGAGRLPALERGQGAGLPRRRGQLLDRRGAGGAGASGWSCCGVPVEAVAGPVALYLADRRGRCSAGCGRGERWLEAHRTHVYQRWCDAGWSHAEVTLLTSALTVLLCLLGVAGMLGGAAVRVAADLAGLAVLAAYLSSPGLFARAGLAPCAGLRRRRAGSDN